MDVREKLVGLLSKECNCVTYEAFADHLIANGVTVQGVTDNNVGCKWIPVTKRLPENIGLYLVIEKHWLDGSPCRKVAIWNTADWFTSDRKRKEITPRVTHWIPLPEPPKEDTE